ncbi:hypothetical protein C8R43DRAFT_982236 [Mycena crocata]|nr:hypothetical protein C8R43DRAFT_982236 [Mycena crocata]
MSSPFIYSPHTDFFPRFPPPSAYAYPPNINSPFVPNETVYPSSPYLGPPLDDQGTPNTPERHFFSGLNDYGAGNWNTPRRRGRRLSWHGASAPRVSPFIPPPLLPPSLDRWNSWAPAEPPQSAGWYPPAYQPYQRPMAPPFSAPPFTAPLYSSSYVPGYPQFPGPLHIHPWINGDVPSPEFVFDLSISGFNPQRMIGPGQAAPLSMADYQAPAFHPPVTKLRICCDMIPNWPVDLILGGGGGMQPPPITLGDILVAIHQKMHQRISHLDWGRLSMSEEAAVSRAFTRRCRMESMRRDETYRSDGELPERQQGVKVVDFLLGKTMFRGLVRSEDGYVKMIVS